MFTCDMKWRRRVKVQNKDTHPSLIRDAFHDEWVIGLPWVFSLHTVPMINKILPLGSCTTKLTTISVADDSAVVFRRSVTPETVLERGIEGRSSRSSDSMKSKSQHYRTLDSRKTVLGLPCPVLCISNSRIGALASPWRRNYSEEPHLSDRTSNSNDCSYINLLLDLAIICIFLIPDSMLSQLEGPFACVGQTIFVPLFWGGGIKPTDRVGFGD